MNEIQVFSNPEFGEVRTTTINNEPWFVGKDVAQVLGYENQNRDIQRHVDEEDRVLLGEKTQYQIGIEFDYKALGQRGGWLINESGLYSLILSSKLPGAKKFKRWVTSEVLPSIHRNGGYIAGQEELSDTEPKALFADSVTASNTSILIGELAKLIRQNGVDMGEKRLFEWMRNNGFLVRRKGTDYNMPTQRSMEMGLFQIKETTVNHASGYTTVNKTPKVTGKGQQYFINIFLNP